MRETLCQYDGARDHQKAYFRSLSLANQWDASGGKSGASFSKTMDERFIVKHISKTEFQMWMDCAPAYFEYMAKVLFHGRASVLVKIVGVHEIETFKRRTGKRKVVQVIVMENLFHQKRCAKTFDLKGAHRQIDLRNLLKQQNLQKRQQMQWEAASSTKPFEDSVDSMKNSREVEFEESLHSNTESVASVQPKPASGGGAEDKVLLDDNLLEWSRGLSLPLMEANTDTTNQPPTRPFQDSYLNDTLFLSLINVVDYSVLVGIDEENRQLVVGIIDYLRQYDLIKKMETVAKSVGTTIAGHAEPTVIQPSHYKNRFTSAMERYFQTVPDKFSCFEL
jgi:1-phosphatidylinositol-3-phosphate 5-kinase